LGVGWRGGALDVISARDVLWMCRSNDNQDSAFMLVDPCEMLETVLRGKEVHCLSNIARGNMGRTQGRSVAAFAFALNLIFSGLKVSYLILKSIFYPESKVH